MRTASRILFALLLVVPGALYAEDDDQIVVKDEDCNFEIKSPPDSIDWQAPKLSDERKAFVKAYFITEFTDSEPLAGAYVELQVIPLPKRDARMGLDKIAHRWRTALEANFTNPRERKEGPGTFGGQPSFDVDVQGDRDAGTHRLTYTVGRNGKFLYLFYVTRAYDAVDDEQLEEEIQAIRDSFKYLKIEKVVGDSKAKPTEGPAVGPAAADAEKEKEIDPEKLKKERFGEAGDFWRFSCVKPEGLVVQELSDNDRKLGVKHYFRNDRNYARLLIRIWAQTDKSKKFTLEQLVDQKISEFKKYDKVKQAQDPVIDKRFKFPMAKKAIKLELLGRATVKIHRIWVLLDCTNDRQYQLEIYLSGSQGYETWKKEVEEFIKEFKPRKK